VFISISLGVWFFHSCGLHVCMRLLGVWCEGPRILDTIPRMCVCMETRVQTLQTFIYLPQKLVSPGRANTGDERDT